MADLKSCALAAKSLALNTTYVLPENVTAIVQKAHYNAAGLALEANLLTDENAREVLAKAYWQAMGVTKYLPADMQAEVGSVAAAPVTTHAHEEKKEEKKEEDAAAGLGSLFG